MDEMTSDLSGLLYQIDLIIVPFTNPLIRLESLSCASALLGKQTRRQSGSSASSNLSVKEEAHPVGPVTPRQDTERKRRFSCSAAGQNGSQFQSILHVFKLDHEIMMLYLFYI